MPKNILNKYFNTWKYKELPDKEIEDIIKTNKKKIIKKRVINLQKRKKDEEEEPQEEEPKVLRGKVVKKGEPTDEDKKPINDTADTSKVGSDTLNKK